MPPPAKPPAPAPCAPQTSSSRGGTSSFTGNIFIGALVHPLIASTQNPPPPRGHRPLGHNRLLKARHQPPHDKAWQCCPPWGDLTLYDEYVESQPQVPLTRWNKTLPDSGGSHAICHACLRRAKCSRKFSVSYGRQEHGTQKRRNKKCALPSSKG